MTSSEDILKHLQQLEKKIDSLAKDVKDIINIKREKSQPSAKNRLPNSQKQKKTLKKEEQDKASVLSQFYK